MKRFSVLILLAASAVSAFAGDAPKFPEKTGTVVEVRGLPGPSNQAAVGDAAGQVGRAVATTIGGQLAGSVIGNIGGQAIAAPAKGQMCDLDVKLEDESVETGVAECSYVLAHKLDAGKPVLVRYLPVAKLVRAK